MKLAQILSGIVVCFWLAFICFPLAWIALMSLKNTADIVAVPPKIIFKPTGENYRALFSETSALGGQGGFLLYFKNSLWITGGALLLTIALGLPAAFALSRLYFPGSERIAFTFLSFRFAPELAVLLPLYIIFQRLKLYDTYAGLILVYQVITLPIFIWMMRSFLQNIPKEVEEAARIDGASWWQIFWRVDLPLVKGGLAASVILCAILAWNNFMFGLILGGRNTQPVTVGALTFMSYEEVLWGQMAAAAMLIIIPELILAMMINRYLLRGLTFGFSSDS